ncbi:MAG TPA: hypothetical protein VJ783_09330 [Pirellulales bacterium]|nr:hypothetical protein [Pirellulales bacterium]
MSRLVVRLGLAAALATAGCTNLQPRTVRIDSAAGMYQNVNIDYRVDTGRLSEPLIVSRIAGRRIRQQLIPSSPYADRSVARLSIQYPHPEGKEGYALAEVVIETRAPRRAGQARKSVWQQWVGGFSDAARDLVPGMPTSDTVYEAWAMDLPRSELDRAVGGLSQGGFFISPPRPAAGVNLAAKIDGYPIVKQWTHVPELDSLVERVRQGGQLVSYNHPIDSEETAMAVTTPGQTDGSGYHQVDLHESDGPSLAPAGPVLPAAAPGNLGPQTAGPAGGNSRSLLPIPDPATMPSAQPPMLPSQNAPPRRWQLPPQYRRQISQYSTPAAMPNMAGPPTVRSRFAPPAATDPTTFPPPPPGVLGGETVSGERVVSDVPVSKPRRGFFSRWGGQSAAGNTQSDASAGAAPNSPMLRRFPFLARPSGAQSSLSPPPGMPEPPRGTGMDNFYPR